MCRTETNLGTSTSFICVCFLHEPFKYVKVTLTQWPGKWSACRGVGSQRSQAFLQISSESSEELAVGPFYNPPTCLRIICIKFSSIFVWILKIWKMDSGLGFWKCFLAFLSVFMLKGRTNYFHFDRIILHVHVCVCMHISFFFVCLIYNIMLRQWSSYLIRPESM